VLRRAPRAAASTARDTDGADDEEENLLDTAAEAIQAARGDSTKAGAAIILAVAGTPAQVSSKAAEVSAALGDLADLANSEREVLQRAQALLDSVGMRGLSLLSPLPPVDDESDEESQ
jgi:hypothetical protein